MAASKTAISTWELVFATPIRSQNERIADAVTPRRRIPEIVGIRGSSQPPTTPLQPTSATSAWTSNNTSMTSGRTQIAVVYTGWKRRRPTSHTTRDCFQTQRTNRMRDAFNGIRQAVSEIIERINAPIVPSAMVMLMSNAIQGRVSHFHVGIGHVDFGPQRVLPIWELSSTHATQQFQTFRHRTIFRSGLGAGSMTVPRYSLTSWSFKLHT